MHNRNLLIALSLVLAAVAGNIMLRDAMPDVVLGAPDIEYKKNISPIADSEYELGTSSQAWLRATADELCLTADSCITAWSAGASEHVDAGDYVYPGDGDYHSAPYYVGTSTTATSTFVNASTTKFCIAGDCITDITGTNLSITGGTLNASGGGGSGSVGTSSVPTIGHVPYWTTSGDTPELLGSIATGTLTETVTGLELSATRNLIGGASILSLTAGYDIPLSASTTEWAAAYLWGDHSTAGYVLQSYGSTTYALAADWTSIDNYPTGCTNQAVTAIGDTLTCNTMTDAYVADDITASNYLALSAWYATNTDALAQGSVNLYNQTHTGDVTGATALAIANDKVNYNHIVNTATLAANPAFGASECWFGTTGLICEGSSADTNEALFTVTNPTADRTYTFPDSSITVAGLTSAMTGTFDGNNFGGGAIGAGDILYGSAAGVISELAGAAIHNVLKSAGATVSPVWGKIVAYNLSTTSAFADDDIVTFDSASGGFTGLTCAEITGSADLCDSGDANTTYTAAGTLLDLTGTEFSINEGTLTDGKLCTYSSGTGIVCNSDDQTGGGFATSSADYWTQNDLILTEISDVDGSPTLGDLLSWDGDSWANIATNTLNIAWGDLVGTPTDWTGTLDGIEGAAFLTEAEYIASTSNPYITSASNLTTIGTIISGIWNGTVIDHERGGLEADVSAYSGLVAIAGGATAEVDAKSELEAQIADVSDFAEADGDTYSGTHEFTGATVKQQHYPSISFPAGLATTTTATTTLLIGTAGVGHTFNWADCYVTSGTGGIIISDGTNDSNYIAASTTAAQIAFSTNNTFTQGETRQVQVGPLTAAKIACTFNYEDD